MTNNMQKPSETINKIYHEFIGDPHFWGVDNIDLSKGASAKFIEVQNYATRKYLDEIIPLLQQQIKELQKPKYACPMCHRIVDELINPYAALTGTSSVRYCKYCVEDKK